MRIFILGAGATGSLLAQLLERQGHTVWCGDRDPERGRRFLGKKSTIAIMEVNARNPFKAEQFRYTKKFEEKNRAALIDIGAAPGLTNLLVKRAADLLDEAETVHIRLYESSESDDPISQWSPEVSFDEAVSHPRIYRDGRFQLGKRFSEVEKFRFPDPIGSVRVVLAAQDEVATLPHFIPMRELDVKIGGNEIDRLRRWHKLGKLSKSRGLPRRHFPRSE